MHRRPKNRAGWWVAAAIVVVLAIGFSQQILWESGAVLVNNQPPVKADAVVVLGGDYAGDRIRKGAELVKAGYAPVVIVSGGGRMYGRYEAEHEIDYAVRVGYPREIFIPVLKGVFSTQDEAGRDAAEFRQRGLHSVLLVTSPSHTARATRIFRKAAPEIQFHPVAAADPKWNNGYWWKIREGRKTWALEMAKTLTGPFGI
jgi:uncharacterized SAM-binding protein YcdF (DUF218 family)